ncbi:MAG: O-methyltransferase [Acidimicrobiales bacterium]
MTQELWSQVDDYVVDTLTPSDPVLDAALADSDAGGLPPINVAPNQGKLLELLVRSHRAHRVLEIGTLGGYSTIWLARGVDSGGRVVSLELDAHHAEVARKNLARAGFSNLVEVIVGAALETLASLVKSKEEPFDFVFIDADKEGYPRYLEFALSLSHPGTLIVADNVVRDGEVIDPKSADERVRGVREFLALAASDARLEGTVVQTVGTKGYDGFGIFLVR